MKKPLIAREMLSFQVFPCSLLLFFDKTSGKLGLYHENQKLQYYCLLKRS